MTGRKTIWKFQLVVDDLQKVLMPAGAEIRSVQLQHGQLCLWAMVDPDAAKEPRLIKIHGTGNPSIDTMHQRTFIDTVQMGQFVWHVFERKQL